MNFLSNIGNQTNEKHLKYQKKYKDSNELFWGIGIENEFYLEFDKKIEIKNDMFINNHKRERYSVDYFSSYKKEEIDKAFQFFDNSNKQLPLLLNCRSLTHTDVQNNHKTLYTKDTSPNPNFLGETIWDTIIKKNKFLLHNFDETYTFDGDTFEIMTTNFFCTSVNNVIKELSTIKKNFISNIQYEFKQNKIFTDFGVLNVMSLNHPFSIHLTNMNNISMFNNGTLHFNITLPTKINKNIIMEKEKFVQEHKNYIKAIQYLEPLYMSIYGSPDPFSQYHTFNNKFERSLLYSSCSQRCAVSRYIGIGTYDTDKMIVGKLLTGDIFDMSIYNKEYGWYNKYYQNCAYNTLNSLGYDINFNKHYNHGVEIRFFDHLNNINDIEEVLKSLIYLGDFSLENKIKDNPIHDEVWNNLIVECHKFGKNKLLSSDELLLYNTLFNTHFNSITVGDLYYEIITFLKNKYENSFFSKLANKKNSIFNMFF